MNVAPLDICQNLEFSCSVLSVSHRELILFSDLDIWVSNGLEKNKVAAIAQMYFVYILSWRKVGLNQGSSNPRQMNTFQLCKLEPSSHIVFMPGHRSLALKTTIFNWINSSFNAALNHKSCLSHVYHTSITCHSCLFFTWHFNFQCSRFSL